MNKKKQQIVLAAMAAGGENASFNPAQIQKLLFLIDNEIPEWIDGPHFDFKPYEYGPFDRMVYTIVESLHSAGNVNVDRTGQYPQYALTPQGYRQGIEVQGKMPTFASAYLVEAAVWIRTLTFRQLLTAIYAEYPEMAVNSSLPHLAHSARETTAQGAPLKTFLRRSPLQSFLLGMARAVDLMGALNSNDEILRKLQDSLNGVEAVDEVWASVGDDMRNAFEANWRFPMHKQSSYAK